jgi:hypothetical protein
MSDIPKPRISRSSILPGWECRGHGYSAMGSWETPRMAYLMWLENFTQTNAEFYKALQRINLKVSQCKTKL